MSDEFEAEDLQCKQVELDHGELNLFNNFEGEHHNLPFDFEIEDQNHPFDRQEDESKVEEDYFKVQRQNDIRKSISFANLNERKEKKAVVSKTESCIDLQGIKKSKGGKKPNSKNVFIQKIKGLLSDHTLRDKIETENK